MDPTIQTIISTLGMQPHPEGGYYAETYRHPVTITLPDGRIRNLSTTIYYLLENEDRSHFHRLSSDETWFFHTGTTIEILTLLHGKVVSHLLGPRMEAGEVPQLLIPANTWFAACVAGGKGFALVSCTVSPGFDFEDFELATGQQLEQEGWVADEKTVKFLR